MHAILQARGLCIGYAPRRRPRLEVAADLEVELFEGELVCLLGPNGAGKSTLVRTLSGLQKPLAGKVLLRDSDLHALTEGERAQLLGLVLTERVDAGNLSAYALAGLGRYPYTGLGRAPFGCRRGGGALGPGRGRGRGPRRPQRRRAQRRRAAEGDDRPGPRPATGSVLLLDEPTAFLDLPRRVEILQLLRRLAGAGDRAVLLSTHDLDLALRCADRLWLLPPGGPLQTGAPEDLVLSGAFQRTFAGVEFNPATGSFQLEQEPEGVGRPGGRGARCPVDGAAPWNGQVSASTPRENARIRVELLQENDGGGTAWRLRTGAEPRVCATLYEVVGCLKHHLAESREPLLEGSGDR